MIIINPTQVVSSVHLKTKFAQMLNCTVMKYEIMLKKCAQKPKILLKNKLSKGSEPLLAQFCLLRILLYSLTGHETTLGTQKKSQNQ